MKNKTIFIKAVLVVFGLLIMSRIPILVTGNMDKVTFISTLVEVVFFIWGIVVIAKK